MNTFYEVLDGIMISDGHLRIDKSCKNAKFTFVQSEDHSDYVHWVAQFLESYGIGYKLRYNEGKLVRNPRTSKVYQGKGLLQLQTRRYKIFTEQHKRWYIGKQKIVPRDIRLTPVMLAHWMMGDGSLVKHTNSCCYQLKLYTPGFTKGEVEFLRDRIYELYEIKFNMYQDGYYKRTNREYFLQIAKKEDIYNFCNLIESHILPCFKYKIKCLHDDDWLSRF